MGQIRLLPAHSRLRRVRDCCELQRFPHFAPVGLSRLIAHDPTALQYLGNVRDPLSLPVTTPGRWAMSILFALRLHRRLKVRKAIEHHNTGGEPAALEFAPIARRQLSAIMRPDPPTPDDMLEGARPQYGFSVRVRKKRQRFVAGVRYQERGTPSSEKGSQCEEVHCIVCVVHPWAVCCGLRGYG